MKLIIQNEPGQAIVSGEWYGSGWTPGGQRVQVGCAQRDQDGDLCRLPPVPSGATVSPSPHHYCGNAWSAEGGVMVWDGRRGEWVKDYSQGDVTSQLEMLLERGTRESFRESPLPNAMLLWEVLWHDMGHMLDYYGRLPYADKFSFVKSIAALEDQLGARGSVSLIHYLIGKPEEADRQILGWVIEYSDVYYYSNARSLSELDFEFEQKQIRRQQRDEEHMRDRVDAARRATARLFGAVRRKDHKAVAALIARGADFKARASDGRTLIEIALAIGDEIVISQLQEAVARINEATNS